MTDPAPKTPADRFIARFGVKQLAAWTGRHSSRVHAWSWPKSKGGTGGVIPVQVRGKIIEGVKGDLREVLAWPEFEPQEGETYLPDSIAEPVP